jgi:hypothetical protein
MCKRPGLEHAVDLSSHEGEVNTELSTTVGLRRRHMPILLTETWHVKTLYGHFLEYLDCYLAVVTAGKLETDKRRGRGQNNKHLCVICTLHTLAAVGGINSFAGNQPSRDRRKHDLLIK